MTQSVKNSIQWTALISAVVLVMLFMYFSNGLVKSLGQEETEKMELWSKAYREMFVGEEQADMSFECEVIKANTTIPVFYTEADGTMLGYKNIVLPLSMTFWKTTTEADTIAYLQQLIPELEEKGNVLEIEIMDDWKQYLYYDESILLQRLHYYPYVQLMAILVLILLFYYMFVSRKRAEQNRVWVGLSKETAHQLGTPIQSLMGWTEYLKSLDSEETLEAAAEMEKDVNRLHLVAERFSKIGSEPKMEPTDLRPIVQGVTEYMRKRASKHINITCQVPNTEVIAPLCGPLFTWVIENLCKNAIDAQDKAEGKIHITLGNECVSRNHIFIEVSDNGKGIAKNCWKSIFEAGYTTKARGWGLGLALVKRIVCEYHHGTIFVKESMPGKGTTFRIEL